MVVHRDGLGLPAVHHVLVEPMVTAVVKRAAIAKMEHHVILSMAVVLVDVLRAGQEGSVTRVFQKRIDGSVSFSRNWTEYQHGFGNASTEYWLGNEAMHALTFNPSSLYVKLQNTNGRHYFRYYSDFRISGAGDDYRLHLGSYSNGTAKESLISDHNNKTFKTPDHSSPASLGCFSTYTQGGWWFCYCHSAYLNGVYGSGQWTNPWYSEIGSGNTFRSSQMLTRRHN